MVYLGVAYGLVKVGLGFILDCLGLLRVGWGFIWGWFRAGLGLIQGCCRRVGSGFIEVY